MNVDLSDFLSKCPTAWHSIEFIRSKLLSRGFIELKENKPWNIHQRNKYFIVRNGSSLCAFQIPEKRLEKCMILATHTDSPSLKLKPNCEFYSDNLVLFGLEVYGEPLLSSWLNRDLGIAGRIVTLLQNNELQEELVTIEDAPCIIPQLALHLDRDVNEKGLILNRQEHLIAIASTDDSVEKPYLHSLLKPFTKNNTLLSHDLFLYPLEKPRFIGKNKELISSYRIDNLASTHAALTAFLEAKSAPPDQLTMITFLDNEEIGSRTAQGADSSFFNDTLERTTSALNLSFDELCRIKAGSLNVSIDLAHAIHPNYLKKQEPNHPIHLSKGIVLKSNANMRYATDALSSSIIAALCKRLSLPLQKFVNRTDMPCGSTIGPIHASKSGIRTVDIGSPQLSMHSCREITSTKDHASMCTLLQALIEHGPLLCS